MTTALDQILSQSRTFSAFLDHRDHLCTDRDLALVVQAARDALAEGRARAITIFDDASGNRTEVEPEGDLEALRQRLQPAAETPPERQGPGRPRLGVVAREISLLPRHWEWLATQPGGASAALRRLVDQARKTTRARDAARQARDAAFRAMTILVGDQPGFEEASRALYAEDFGSFQEWSEPWPEGQREHLRRLADVARSLGELAGQEAAGQGG